MLVPPYYASYGFELIKSALTEEVHPARLQVLHLMVHNRAEYDYAFDPRVAARDYVAFLGLPPEAVGYLHRVFREQAQTASTNVAEFSLISGDRQMEHMTAVALAVAWIARFDEGADFFLSAWGALDSPPDPVGGGYDLFSRDREAGVLAVSPARVGLFWSAEDS